MTTTTERLDAIEALARAATPGPWGMRSPADAAYIAALSPDVALALVAVARAAEGIRAARRPENGGVGLLAAIRETEDALDALDALGGAS